MRYLLPFLISVFGSLSVYGQFFQALDTIKPPVNFENVYSKPVFSDSLSSSFVIYIKKEVKSHRHATHSEQVYILEGKGDMSVGNKILEVKKGDLIFIPMNTAHSLKVLSSSPMKVLSIQSPHFDGKDRVMTGE